MQSSTYANVDRRERLRRMALETVDLSKDPYFMKNHLGSYECKLCLTLHNNEGNYLAHTQGKRHKTNLSRRLAKEQLLAQQQQQVQQNGIPAATTTTGAAVSAVAKPVRPPKVGSRRAIQRRTSVRSPSRFTTRRLNRGCSRVTAS